MNLIFPDIVSHEIILPYIPVIGDVTDLQWHLILVEIRFNSTHFQNNEADEFSHASYNHFIVPIIHLKVILISDNAIYQYWRHFSTGMKRKQQIKAGWDSIIRYNTLSHRMWKRILFMKHSPILTWQYIILNMERYKWPFILPYWLMLIT